MFVIYLQKPYQVLTVKVRRKSDASRGGKEKVCIFKYALGLNKAFPQRKIFYQFLTDFVRV